MNASIHNPQHNLREVRRRALLRYRQNNPLNPLSSVRRNLFQNQINLRSPNNQRRILRSREENQRDFQSAEQGVCPLCLDDMNRNNTGEYRTVSLHVCGHFFHYECLFRWIETSRTCPLCCCCVTDAVESDDDTLSVESNSDTGSGNESTEVVQQSVTIQIGGYDSDFGQLDEDN